MEMNEVNYMLEIDILRNSSQKDPGVLRGALTAFYPNKFLSKKFLPLSFFSHSQST